MIALTPGPGQQRSTGKTHDNRYSDDPVPCHSLRLSDCGDGGGIEGQQKKRSRAERNRDRR